jgi:hydrogenase-4 component B
MARLAYLVGVGLGLLATGLGLWGVLGHRGALTISWLIPLAGLELALDPLGGLFLTVVGGVTATASLYACGYAGRERRGVLVYLVFVVAMSMVTVAANAPTFLVAWELMSLASYFLVLHRPESPAAVRAAWVYAVMSHAGIACLMVGMLLLGSWSGSLRFADWPAAAAALDPSRRNLAFAFLAVGFASKAGMIPLHVWLPLAHPAAPSHVSALMSGAMVKLGVFGLLRAGGEWLGGGPPWWGVAILLVGALSAVVGMLYAVVDCDLKRVLAFSSIENVGVIFVGIGAALAFRHAGLEALAVLALVAALYHTVNHAAFKALLFLGAGAVVHSAGTADMEALGGLGKRMPWTAACFLVGCLGIAGLPPLNGFVSEWLTFQALLQNLSIQRAEVNLVFALGLAGLALTAGLAVACFVRAYGITFLALPRSAAARQAHEAAPTMRAAMVLLALTCVGLGLGATLLVGVLSGVAAPLLGTTVSLPASDWLTLAISDGFGSLSPLGLAGALAGGLAATALLLTVLGAHRGLRRYETWGCGRLVQTARMQYTATAFANPFTRIFDFFYRPEKQLDIEFHPESRFFVQRIEYENPTRSVFEDWLYRPMVAAVRVGARRVRAIQSGSANLYLIYILAALLLMLVLA